MDIEVVVAEDAASRLAEILDRSGADRVRMVADRNTRRAGSKAVERAVADLGSRGVEVAWTVFADPFLAASAGPILELLVALGGERPLLVALGSGTICDITRFVAHRACLDFVSVPTAPSVDAYSSIVAPIVIDGVKKTVGAKAPVAILADPAVLSSAPRPMIAAGFGDMICKFSAVADWRLGALVAGEGYDAAIAGRSLAAARKVESEAGRIGRAEEGGVHVLFDALVESGRCMAQAGHSRPASGAEHQYSHYWEMKSLREGRPPILHGLKVGVATVIVARYWDLVRGMSRDEAARRLASNGSPLGEKIAAGWDAIGDIASTVPSRARTRELLAAAGCPTEPGELGLGPEEVASAETEAHLLRDRFTIRKLALALGVR